MSEILNTQEDLQLGDIPSFVEAIKAIDRMFITTPDFDFNKITKVIYI